MRTSRRGVLRRIGLTVLLVTPVGCAQRALDLGDGTGASNHDGGSGTGGTTPGGIGGRPATGSGGVGGADGLGGYGGQGGQGNRGIGGTGIGGAGAGIGGSGLGGAGAGIGGSGLGGAGVGGALGGCDSACEPNEMCVSGICRGSLSRWPTLGGDVHHSGFNANETGTPPLMRAWSVPLAGPMGLWPAVSDGSLVYVSEHGYFDKDIRMWALSPADGHVVWTYDFGNIFGVGQATVDSGHVYVAQCNNGGSSYMYSLVASTGKLFWSTPIGAQWENYWAPLVVPGGSIYFDGGSYGGLYGLSNGSGAQRFFNSTLEQYDEWSPLFLNGRLYTFIAGNLRTHDLVTGSAVSTVSVTWNWSGWSMMTSPISDGDKIYFIAPPSLYALRVGEGNPKWSATSAFTGMPAVANGAVYAISGRQLRVQDADTGAVLWSFAGDGALSYPPVVAGHFVYVASDANAYAVDTTTQQVVWTDAPGGWLSIAGGQLYVAQQNGTLAAHGLTH